MNQNKLTARQLRSPKNGTMGDGGGLYLRTRNGSSTWVFRYSYGGKVREMGLGVLGLVEARERAVACRAQVKAGVDPKADFADYQSTGNTTFRQASDRYLILRADDWVPRQAQQWRSTLTTYADPLMGMPVDQINTRHVAACLTPIWREKHVTASRVRERIERVLSASIALSERDGPNPATWRDNLETILGKPRRQVKHHPAVPVAEAPAAFARLWQDRDSGQGVRAVLLVALTGLRSGEVRNLLWDDIDGDTITIPPERMKARREHRLPMAYLLADWPRWANSELVLPNSRGQALSGVTLTRAMTKVGLGDYSVHGWRSTFSEWAHESGWNYRWVEDALAHTIGSDVERAYRRSDYLEQRRALMADWAKYLMENVNNDIAICDT